MPFYLPEYKRRYIKLKDYAEFKKHIHADFNSIKKQDGVHSKVEHEARLCTEEDFTGDGNI